MKRTNKIMMSAILGTVVLANVFAGASAFAAEETTTAAPAATTETAAATEAAATATAETAPAATETAVVKAGDVIFRIDEGTYVEIRDVYGNPVWVPAVTVTAPTLKAADPVAIFGGSISTVVSKTLDSDK